MRTRRLAPLLIAALLMPFAHSQEIASLSRPRVLRGAATQPAEFTIRKTVDEVHLVFTVVDKQGRLIPDLTRQDFAIVDDRTTIEAITDFRSQADLPLRLGLLVDVSASVERQFAQQQEAAIAFLTGLMRPTDKAFAAAFGSRVEIPETLSSQTDDLAGTIRALRNPGGLTAVYDAVVKGAERLAAVQEFAPVRRAIVLISDGEDTYSLHSFSEALGAAQRANVAVYAISIHSRRRSSGNDVLRELAAATGGRALFPANVSELAKAFAQINDELRAQYLVAYRPPALAADGRFHRIAITTTAGKKLQVRARAGYFAPLPDER
jgi:Ca-activated chloride channel homolog